MKGRGTKRHPRKPAYQRYRLARFSHAKVRSDPVGKHAGTAGVEVSRDYKDNHARFRPQANVLRAFSEANPTDEILLPAEKKAAPVREIPEKTRLPTASSGMIPTCDNPVTRLGIELHSPWWESSVLIALPPWPPRIRNCSFITKRNTWETTAILFCRGAAVVQWYDYSPPTKVNRVRLPAESLEVLHVGSMLDVAVGRWIFSGLFHFPPPLHSPIVPSPHNSTFTVVQYPAVNQRKLLSSSALDLFSYVLLKGTYMDEEPLALVCNCSPPTYRRTGFDSRRGLSRIFAGLCRWSAGFLWDLPFPTALYSGIAPYSPHFTLIGSQDFHRFRLLLTVRSREPSRVIEVCSGSRMNGRGETVDPRGNPPASGIVLHVSHVRKSESGPAGDRARFTLVGGEQANRSANTTPPPPAWRKNAQCEYRCILSTAFKCAQFIMNSK
ncbi:hypothetical protein PR048_001476 [Dryococelus australis]|uniref:Ribosomal protein L2 n=1 Tax=Dryococelus australis TaxID=614101 RepID=A0ABQ9IHG5_9NEOP|nr:hypothetical protein PR048_001476 [Dryococelus australis]